jgi:ATP-dependent Clp protease adapter protein ClpS
MAEHKNKSEIEQVIAEAIARHPDGDPEALAREIIFELHRAGRFIVPRDPTDKMNTAVAKSRDQGHWGLDSAWRAMVDAAE